MSVSGGHHELRSEHDNYRSKRGTVYVMATRPDSGGQPRYKVGLTRRDVETRRRKLSTGCPYPLEIIFTAGVWRPGSVEADAHRLLERHRTSGEWFSCGADVAILAVQSAVARNGMRFILDDSWPPPEEMMRAVFNWDLPCAIASGVLPHEALAIWHHLFTFSWPATATVHDSQLLTSEQIAISCYTTVGEVDTVLSNFAKYGVIDVSEPIWRLKFGVEEDTSEAFNDAMSEAEDAEYIRRSLPGIVR